MLPLRACRASGTTLRHCSLWIVPAAERTKFPTFLHVPIRFLVYLIRKDRRVHLWQFGLSHSPARRPNDRARAARLGTRENRRADLPIVGVESIRTKSAGWEGAGSQRPVKWRREPDRGKSAERSQLETAINGLLFRS